MFGTDEIKWLIGTLLVGALVIFGLFMILPKGFVSGLFGSERQTIQDTPLAVKEIRGIGELIAAEYYGEVIHSLNDGYTDLETNRVRTYYNDLHTALDSLYNGYALMVRQPPVNTRSLGGNKRRFARRNRRQAAEPQPASQNNEETAASEDQPEATTVPLSSKELAEQEEAIWEQVMQDAYLVHLMSSNYFNLLMETVNLNGLRSKREMELCKIAKARIWDAYMQNTQWRNRLESKIDELNRANQAAIELTYLGRGWVKAGYNLHKLSDEQIDRRGDTLIINNINPEILNADINPWFIPPSKHFKEGSPGFTVLRVRVNGKDVENVESGQGRRSDRNKIPFWAIDSVKRGTKRALLLNALQSHILDSARTSAERTLLRLFQLVEPDTLNQIQVLKMKPSIWFTRNQQVMRGDYCISAAETDSLRSYFAQDTTAIDAFLESTKRKQRNEVVKNWQAFVLNAEYSTLCVANDPAWNDWRDEVLALTAD
jgi:hypothetical protein